MSETTEILKTLVAFPTVSAASNLAMADWIQAYLEGLGFLCQRVSSPDGQKVGLLARIGPGDGGVLVSAHMDVVPVEGQPWTRPAFALTTEAGRLYGRGTTDMKGFLASALVAAKAAAKAPLQRPFMLSLSYDEEVGCRGIRDMAPHVIPTLGRPDLCIVGEPTSMQIATGHKGKLALRATCHGQAGHSASAPRYLNALQLAARLIVLMADEQDRLMAQGARDADYDVPVSTIHAGRMAGGIALNIVPDQARVEFEIRHLAADDPDAILARIRDGANAICKSTGHPAARIEIEVTNAYPGLDTDRTGGAVRTLRTLLPDARLTKVGFGTEAGFFDALGIPTLVCGPGSMDQGHQPDEYIEQAELDRCDAFLGRVIAPLSA